jgi:D-alanyl-D-alanine carboxypeptidase (penicillin-binding protein 5/6)
VHQPARGRLRELRLSPALCAFVVALVALGGPATASAKPAEPPGLDARAWVLIDAADGEVLAGRAANRSYPVASTTKLMTAYVSRRALPLDKKIVAPEYVPSSSAESLLGLTAGERITVRDLLYGLILASGNDAAVALADAAAGSVPAFVERMNRGAARLGLDSTHYANPIGLDDPGNYSSAADLVDLAADLRRDRAMREIFDAPDAVLESGARTRQIVNRNNLVRTVPWVNGIKTGYTLGAGNVLVASGKRQGVDLISAVLGAPSEAARDAGSLELLEYGFSLYHRERPVADGAELAEATVAHQDLTLPLVAAEPVELIVRRGQELEVEVDSPAEVEGPIDRGEPLGEAIVRVDGDAQGRTALVAGTAIPEATIADRVDSALPGSRLAAWALVTLAIAAIAIAAIRLLGRRGDQGRATR